MVQVNTAALEAVLDAAEQLRQIKLALGLASVSYVLGEEDPVGLDTCIDLLRKPLKELDNQ